MYPDDPDDSGLYELSGLKKIFEEVEKWKEEEKKRKEADFWKFEDEEKGDDIDEFWTT